MNKINIKLKTQDLQELYMPDEHSYVKVNDLARQVGATKLPSKATRVDIEEFLNKYNLKGYDYAVIDETIVVKGIRRRPLDMEKIIDDWEAGKIDFTSTRPRQQWGSANSDMSDSDRIKVLEMRIKAQNEYTEALDGRIEAQNARLKVLEEHVMTQDEHIAQIKELIMACNSKIDNLRIV
jgi:uncharacterized coiled-coil protein SlyX